MKKKIIKNCIAVIVTVLCITGCAFENKADTATSTTTSDVKMVPVDDVESESNKYAISYASTSAYAFAKNSTASASNSIDAIASISGLKSTVETNVSKCIVYLNGHNPYDVTYDYGKAYKEYVKACDWSLVFDADYYIETFPTLALLYNNDKALLLEHFQTVGIHEGRQGSKNFNVGSYMNACNSSVSKAFGDNYECYYIYYMLNYNTEKSVNVAPTANTKTQYKVVMTAMQADEFKHINIYRKAVNVAPVEYNEALCEFANYRAYINVAEGWDAHDWLIDVRHRNAVDSELYKYLDTIDTKDHYMTNYGENNVTTESTKATRPMALITAKYKSYYDSPPHYKAMVSPSQDIVGTSNYYYGALPTNPRSSSFTYGTYSGSTFDCYCEY